ncbi:MAG: hypothetical protein V4661_15525 [Pseudomonadota bacterium]
MSASVCIAVAIGYVAGILVSAFLMGRFRAYDALGWTLIWPVYWPFAGVALAAEAAHDFGFNRRSKSRERR